LAAKKLKRIYRGDRCGRREKTKKMSHEFSRITRILIGHKKTQKTQKGRNLTLIALISLIFNWPKRKDKKMMATKKLKRQNTRCSILDAGWLIRKDGQSGNRDIRLQDIRLSGYQGGGGRLGFTIGD